MAGVDGLDCDFGVVFSIVNGSESLCRFIRLLLRKQKRNAKSPKATAAEATPATAIPAICGADSDAVLTAEGVIAVVDVVWGAG